MAQKAHNVVLYHHTHWDREWWSTYQDFRFRLVGVIDKLLATLESDPAFTCFVLDGQMSVLQDYLEVRPENRERLVGFIRAGRIHVGPWYILPDEFLISGEAVVRNLLLARRIASELGVPMAGVGYLPDSFGHIAQMPQILRGFGYDNAVVWRGFGPLTNTEFIWEAPDGSRLLGIYLAKEYYLGFWPATPEGAADFVKRFVDHMAPRARTPYILEPYGGDHLSVDDRLPALIPAVNGLLKDAEVRQGSLAEFIDLIRAHAPSDLVVWKGEARAFGHDLTYILPGVFSARLNLKQANYWCQNWLERYAEPLQGLSWAAGGSHESRLLWMAWESLLQNQPHDSICGCSIDPVHRQMGARFEASREVAEILSLEALAGLCARIDTTADGEHVIVYNPLHFSRTDAVRALLPGHRGLSPRTHALLGPDGEAVPFQARPVTEWKFREPRSDWTELCFTAPEVPGLGYKCFRLVEQAAAPLRTPVGQAPRVPLPFGVLSPAALEKGHESPADLRVGALAMENRYLSVSFDAANGTVTAVDRETGARYEGLNLFEDGGDAGDEYNYSPPVNDQIFTTAGLNPTIELVEPGPAKATYRVTYEWPLPEALSGDRLNRVPVRKPFVLRSYVTLYAGVRRLEFRTEWENGHQDHRLRVRFPLGAPAVESEAESAFCAVARPVVEMTGGGSIEPTIPTHPQQSFVSVTDGQRGLTLLNRGLPEFEVLPDGQATVCLTLLRSVGWLARGDLMLRYGGAGPKIPAPEAQMPGAGSAEYAVVLHGGRWLQAGAHHEAHAFGAPLLSRCEAAHPGEWPTAASLVAVQAPDSVVVSTVKRSESGDRLLVRMVNMGAESADALVNSRLPFTGASLVNLAEEPVGALAVTGQGARCTLGAHQIVTVALEIR